MTRRICRLFLLPQILIIEILSLWLTAESLARLDSATTDKRYRKGFLELLKSHLFISYGLSDSSEVLLSHYFEWLALRSVAVRRLAVSASDMSALNLSAPSSANTTMKLLGDRFQQLEELVVTGHWNVFSLVQRIVSPSRRLKTLQFSECNWLTYPRARKLLNMCQHSLLSLKLDGIGHIDGNLFVKLLPLCTHLTDIFVSRLVLTKVVLSAIQRYCPDIQSFAFQSCVIDHNSLVEFIRNYGTNSVVGEKITLNRTITVSSQSRKNLMQSPPHMSMRNQLSLIDISNSTGLRRDEIAQTIASCCNSVSSLLITGENFTPDHIDNAALMALASSCCHIRYFDLSRNDLLSHEALDYMAQHCIYLRTLVLNTCIGVTDMTIESICKYLHGLEYLDVSGCIKLTNDSLEYITRAKAPFRNSLRTLKLLACFRITSRTLLNEVLRRCRKLKMEHVAIDHKAFS